MFKWKAHCARFLAILMVFNLLVVPGVAQATDYTNTINMSNDSNGFFNNSAPNKSQNETFSTSTDNNTAFLTWDATNIYLGYQSADLAHYNNSNANNKWLIAYFGVPGTTGTTTSGVDYSGQQPTLPFEAKYHFRFKAGNNNYTSLEVTNGTTWSNSKTYNWTTDMRRDTGANPVFYKVRIPRADLGLTNAKTLQVVMGMLYEAPTSASMWGAVPGDSFTGNAGFDRNFNTFYELDLKSINTAAAAQVFMYDFKPAATNSVTASTASFTFRDNAGATSVKVQQSTDLGNTWTDSTLSSALTATSTSATVTGLTANTDYKFRLVVAGGADAGSSAIVNLKTLADTQKPTAPTNLSSSAVTGTSATVSWTSSTDNVGVSGYEIFNGTTSLGTSTTATFNLTGLTQFTTYNITVKAKDAAGNESDASTALILKTLDTTAPTVPSNLTSSGLTSSSVTVSWTASTDNPVAPAANAGLKGYEIYANDGSTDVLAGTVNSPSTSFTLTGLTPEKTYNITVKAKDLSDNISAASTPLPITTPAKVETEPPTVPANLASSDVTTTGFKVSWTASTDNVGVTAYEVYNNDVLVTSAVTDTFYVFSGLSEVSSNKVTVKARDAAGNVSAASGELTVKTLDGTAPSKPSKLAATNVTATGFTVNWDASTDNVAVIGYEVYNGSTLVDTVVAPGYSFSGLSQVTKYTITVKAKDAAGNLSAVSDGLDVTTKDSIAPTVPSGLASSSITSTGFTVTWSASTDNVAVAGYEVFNNSTKVADVKTTSYTFTGLTKASTNVVTVLAYDADGNKSAQSSSISVTTDNKNEIVLWYKKGFATPYIHFQPAGGNWTTAPGTAIPPSGVAGYNKVTIDLGTATSITAVFNGNNNVWENNSSKNYTINAGVYTYTPGATPTAAGTITAGEPDLSSFNWVTIYYTKGFTTPYIHYQVDTGAWTATPGELLPESELKNFRKIIIPVAQTAKKITAAFTNGTTWDNNAEKNYTFDVEGKTNPVFTFVAGTGTTVGKITAEAPDSVPPSVPGGLKFSDAKPTGFTVSWDASTDNTAVTGYDVLLDGVKVTSVTTTSYTFTGLKDSTLYKVTIRAFDENGNTSASSSALDANTSDTKLPTIPGNVKITDVKNNQLTVTWDAATDNIKVTQYQVFIGTTLAATVETTTATVTGLSENTTYTITVVALDGAGNKSPASAPETATTKETTPPTVPGALTSSEIKTTSFKLTWTASTDNVKVENYEVYLNTVKVATVTQTNFTFVGLLANTAYNVAVKAIDSSDNASVLSDAITVTTLTAAELVAPTVPTNVVSSEVKTNRFDLSWTASTDNVGVTGYEVFLNGVLQGTSTTTSFKATDLKQNTSYKVTVKAFDDSGNRSDASAEITVLTADGEAPTVPSGLASSNLSKNGFTITWNASTDNVGVKEYEVYLGKELQIKTALTTYTFSGLISGISYAVTIRAVDQAGNKSELSNALTVKTPGNLPYAHTIEFPQFTYTNSFFTSLNPDKSKNETFNSSTPNTNVGYLTWDANHLYLGYQSADLAHTTLEKKWFIAYFGLPGVKGSTNGVEYSGQQPTLPFEAKYHLRFQTGFSNYTSLEVFNGSSWVMSKEYKWTTDMARDINAKPVFWKIKIPRADLGLTDATSLQVVMAMLFEETQAKGGSMWGAIPDDSIDAAGFDKNFSSFYEFDLLADKSAPAAQFYNYRLKATTTTATTANLTFSSSVGATALQVQQSSDNGATWFVSSLAQPLNANSTMATVTGLNPSTTYKFKLVVTGGANEGSSTLVTATTADPPDTQAPDAPTALAASEIKMNSIKISWTAAKDNVGVAKYEIFSAGVKLGESVDTSFTATGLTEETDYSFIVYAIDAASNKSVASETLNAKTLAAPAEVTIFYKKRQSTDGFNTPHISYKIGSEPTTVSPGLPLLASDKYAGFFTIKILLNLEKSMVASFNNGVTDETKWDKNGTAGYTFNKGTYTFVADENGGVGTILAGTPDEEAPSAPIDLSVTNKTDKAMTLTWKAATDNVGVTSYIVYRNNIKLATVTEPSYTDNDVVNDTYYTYTVIARDATYNASGPSKELRISLNDSIFEKIDRTTDITVTTATIDGDKLIKQIEGGAITIELLNEKSIVRQIRFELPASAIQTISSTNSNAVVTLKTTFGSVDFPINSLALPTIAGLAGTNVNRLKLIFVIKRADSIVNEEFKFALESSGSSLLQEAVEYKVLGQSSDITRKPHEVLEFAMRKTSTSDPQLYSFVGRQFVLKTEKPFVETNTSVMSYNPTTKRIQFVPATFEKIDETQVLVKVKSPVNLIFGIVESKRTFTDVVGRTDRAAIETLANKGIIRGTTDTTFSPTVTVKRGQFATLLVRALGLIEDPDAASVFRDVARSNPFAGAIGAAVKTGLVRGTSPGVFSWNAEITRAEMAVMLERAATFVGKPIVIDTANVNQILIGYNDRLSIPQWARPSVARVFTAGIVSPRATFGPTVRVTRAETAVVLKRLLEHIEFMSKS